VINQHKEVELLDMSALAALKSVQFVVGQDGHPIAVQMGIDTWNALLDWLEDNEDRSIVKAAIPALRGGPMQAGALRWDDVKAEWDDLPAVE
jgi:hypothetical protein